MKDDKEGVRSTTYKGNLSPFAGWFKPGPLYQEADRIRALPPSGHREIERWRRNRLWQIEQRLREIYASREANDAPPRRR